MDRTAEFFEWARGGGAVEWTTLFFGYFRVLISLLVGEIGVGSWGMLAGKGGWRMLAGKGGWRMLAGKGGWRMLAGKGGWRKGLYEPFRMHGRCMDMVLKGFFLL